MTFVHVHDWNIQCNITGMGSMYVLGCEPFTSVCVCVCVSIASEKHKWCTTGRLVARSNPSSDDYSARKAGEGLGSH